MVIASASRSMASFPTNPPVIAMPRPHIAITVADAVGEPTNETTVYADMVEWETAQTTAILSGPERMINVPDRQTPVRSIDAARPASAYKTLPLVRRRHHRRHRFEGCVSTDQRTTYQ
ncbi:hypothetical protein [Salinisphaera sp. RV14]|uniref:hypothetical protein n=1 Tax=Salinisphaera sp. RV14 TaxID=3454140 RepID=UPI003F87FEA6